MFACAVPRARARSNNILYSLCVVCRAYVAGPGKKTLLHAINANITDFMCVYINHRRNAESGNFSVLRVHARARALTSSTQHVHNIARTPGVLLALGVHEL